MWPFLQKNELIHSGVGTVHLRLLPVLHNKCAEAKRSIFIYNALPLLPLYLVKPSSISSNFKMFFVVCYISALWYAILMWTASSESKDWRKFTVRRRHKIYNVVVEEELLEIDHACRGNNCNLDSPNVFYAVQFWSQFFKNKLVFRSKDKTRLSNFKFQLTHKLTETICEGNKLSYLLQMFKI